ncbi:MAG TPA: hemerythrin domain-containing protein [Candidatus Paceibacterota bacterium]|nr:hemerythrin domain-containing protein [Candidatus Paceibacterota bacterium]
MAKDAIDIIKHDHRKVEELFKEYEELGETAHTQKRMIADTIISELETHAEMEELYCYPRFKEALADEDESLVEEATAEHDVAKSIIAELKTLEPEDPQFDAKVKVLKENIEHHVKEEEHDLLPKAKKKLEDDTLEEMAEQMMEFKASRGATE